MKVRQIVILSLFLCLVILNASEAHNKRCNKTFKCSKHEDPVYASDGINTCQHFRNKCWFENENCNRLNRYEIELKKTTAQKCKPLCPKYCTEVYAPICGEYRYGLYEFVNICYMNRYNCLTGTTHLVLSATRCTRLCGNI